jgi:Ala-tRNA(Pro) deacylase
MNEPHSDVTTRLRAWLDSEGITYRYLEHGPTRTSEESAAARREPLEIGAKALLLKADASFVLVVLSAARKLDSKALAKHLGVKKSRFASADELMAVTGLIPGSVPPFGSPIFDLPLHIDRSITTNEKTAFNAGSLTASIVMQTADYLRLAGGVIADVTVP